MAFITESDLLEAIKADMLEAVLDGNDITKTADTAVAKMQEYLNGKFDIVSIFGATGTDRHTLVVNYAVDITIYMLWKITDPLGIPSLRKDAYKEAMDWLKGCMAGDIATTLPAASESTESGGDLHFGSNTARENQY